MPRPPRSLAAWITIGVLGLAVAWDASGWDLPLARLAGSGEGFPWREQWFLVTVLHEGARRASWLLVLVLSVGVFWPSRALARLSQSRRVQLVVTALLAAVAVSLLKSGSSTSCPWDLAEFGGIARHVSHWQGLEDGGPGRCFPAGHASTGFSLVGGYFAWRGIDDAVALRWLAGSAAGGLLLGLAQQWRGAHFMSHTLWTAAVCWCVALAVDGAFGLQRRGEAA